MTDDEPASRADAATLRHVSVLDALGRDVIAGNLSPGTPITLEQLQVRYGVSRGVVRECMRILEGIGMLSSQRRIGIRVQPESNWDVYDSRIIRWRLEGPERDAQLREFTELRLGLEPFAARLAALRATDEERHGLREIVAMMRVNAEAGRLDDHLECDLAFHSAILVATHNSMYSAVVPAVREALIARRARTEIDMEHIMTALDRHARIATAISDGDEFQAETAMQEVLAEVRAFVSGNDH